MSDFYAYVADTDIIPAYTNGGLTQAMAWCRKELRELGLEDSDLVAPEVARIRAAMDEIAAEMNLRGIDR